MPTNIEIKAKISDISTTRLTASKISDQEVVTIRQHDTFFVTAIGRLKLRDFGDDSGELIYYLREDSPDPTGSEYQITHTDDPAGLRAVLRDALGIRGVVEKTRYLYMRGRTRIHIDAVEGLGDFLELEVVLADAADPAQGKAEAQEIMNLLAIDANQLVHCAYIDLLTADS